MPLAEVSHGCWIGWDARNRALKIVRKKRTHFKRGLKNNAQVSFMEAPVKRPQWGFCNTINASKGGRERGQRAQLFPTI